MKLPDFYNQLKLELQEQEQLKMDRLTDHKAKSKPDRESSYRKQDLAEVILVSFLMQAVQKGFKVRLDRFDFSHPQLFINSLVTAFTDSIKSQEGRSIIVIDRLHLVKQKELAAVIGALTLVLSHDQSEHCSIMLASENTPSISLVIPGYPAVSRDSEYQGASNIKSRTSTLTHFTFRMCTVPLPQRQAPSKGGNRRSGATIKLLDLDSPIFR